MGDMDSGNSGSMQSSSTGGGGVGGGGGGDDQEYDSRGGGGGESISAFFNSMSNFSNMGGGAAAGGSPLQLYSLSNGSSSFTNNNNQVSNYFDHSHQPPTLSQSSSLECPNFMINHNTTTTNNNNNNGTNNDDNNNNQLDMVWPNKFSSIRPSLSTDDANCTEGPFGYSIPNNNHHHQQQQNPPRPLPLSIPSPGPPPPLTSPLSSTAPTITGSGRNPKKRSRASRRAPTTVLTTDTNNFRQMVQEFTGIPSPPFTAFSTRARFDLFGGLGGLTSSAVPPPSYLLRPFPQKIPPLQQPPYLANNPSLPSHTTTTTTTNNNIDGLGLSATPTSTTASTSISTSIAAPASVNFNMCDPQQFLSTNPHLSFQSLLEQTSSALTDHQQDSSMSLGCATVTPHQTSCSVNLAAGNYRGISTITSAAAAAAAAVNGASDNNVGATKGEGMIDSWICSSD